MPLEIFEKRVDVGHHDTECDSLTAMKNKADELRINNWAHLTEEAEALLLSEGREAIEVLPCCVVDCAEVSCCEVDLASRDGAHEVLIICALRGTKEPRSTCRRWGLTIERVGRKVICDLIVVVAKAVALEERLVVGWVVVIFVERSVLKTLNEEPPPCVTGPEVNRTIHSVEAAEREPLASGIEERLRDKGRVDTLEETTPSDEEISIADLLAMKDRDAPNAPPRFVLSGDEARSITMRKERIA